MADLGSPNLFVGDWSDPWVAAIFASLSGDATIVDLTGGWPEPLPDAGFGYDVVVLHRSVLSSRDARMIQKIREGIAPPRRVILVAGPQVRASDLDRCGPLFDVVLPEATASLVLARHLTTSAIDPTKARAGVVASGFEVRRVLVEMCETLGCRATAAREEGELGDATVVLWDVPTLEPDWTGMLAQYARSRAVVALLRFADRAAVARASAAGASACLDWPCDASDLAFVLDRVAPRPAADPPHAVPPPRMGRRSVRGSRRSPGATLE